ncbi:ankyrin [Coprinellus micaceus]|uniref:Ankyrin n=1 Tax=Coprinellus micaceus TaxID=71717 RepID=A0A4Y7SRD7_COPMI|nr:ankyrin [Coprinellus micaceus]
MANTGTWFLELPEFKMFSDRKGTIAWITGMPGSGKSVLAAIAIEYLEKHNIASKDLGIAFAFIRYTESRTLRDILSSLIAQLVEGSYMACSLIHSFYSQSIAKEGAELLESDMIEGLEKIAGALGVVHIVIDGLDEANDQVKDSLLEVLVTSKTNLLILSRPLDLYIHHTPDALFVSIQAQTADIELYVTDQVKRSSRLNAVLQGRPELVKELSTRIKEKANGMFLLAKLQMELIMSSCNSINSLFKALDKLPYGIDEMYRATLDRIAAQPEEDVSIAHRTFVRLVYEFSPWNADTRPMSAEDLRHYLAVSFENQTFDKGDLVPIPLILSTCCGLVIAEEGDQGFPEIRFIHYTTKEFMKNIQFSNIPVEPSPFLAVISMIYLDPHLEPLLALESRPPEELDQYFYANPFLYHAQRSWGFHARMSQRQGLLPRYTHWFLSKNQRYPFIKSSYSPVTSLFGLHLAAIHGLVDVITENTALPCEPIGPEGYTPFHYAAMEGRPDTFRALVLIHQGAELTTAGGQTFMHLAVKHRREGFVRELLLWLENLSPEEVQRHLQSFDINAQDSEKMTPLMLAVSEGWTPGIASLLATRRDIQVNMVDKDGVSAFMLACGCKTSDFAEVLISSFPELDFDRRCNHGRTALMRAARGGNVQVAKLLLSRNPAIVNDVDSAGWTALLHAAYLAIPDQREDILRLLLEHGADQGAKPTAGAVQLTAFLYTANWPWIQRNRRDHEGTARVPLLELYLSFQPESIHQRDHKGRTALMLAIREGGDPPTLSLLLNRSAVAINAQDAEGLTAFLHAFRLLSKINLAEIVETDYPPEAVAFIRSRRKRSDISQSCLRYRRCHALVRDLLLVPSLDASKHDNMGRMALEWACLSAGSHLLGREGFDQYRELYLKEGDMQRQFESTVGFFFATLHRIANHEGTRWNRHAFHRAAVVACSTLADPILARFLQEGWVRQAFEWTVDENCAVVLLVQASGRKCRVAIGVILEYLGLLGSGWDTRWFGSSGVDVAKMFCDLDCSWHTEILSF